MEKLPSSESCADMTFTSALQRSKLDTQDGAGCPTRYNSHEHAIPSADGVTRPMIQLLHRWICHDAERRARKLLNLAETEADGGRDLVRAAELTQDPTLRRLYMVHAADEQRHAALFRKRGTALLRTLPARASAVA